jgi:hypothetical protein
MGLFMTGFLIGGLIGFAAAVFIFASDEEYEDDDEQEVTSDASDDSV